MTKTLWNAALALSLTTAACTDDAAPTMSPPASSSDMPQQPDMAPEAVASGTLDTSFGTGGMRALGLPGYASSITRQGDKLVVCANKFVGSKLVIEVARYLLDGSLDTSFAPGVGSIDTFEGISSLACERIAARSDGSLVMSVRLGTVRFAITLSAEGSYVSQTASDAGISGVTLSGDATLHALNLNNGTVNKLQIIASSDGTVLREFSISDYGWGATANRVFVRDGVYSVTGVFGSGIGTGWGAYRGTASSSDPEPTLAHAGSQQVLDLLHDSILLRDGSPFLVGGVDTDLAVMTAHFDKGVPTVETHSIGAASSAKAVVLDGADRPVVVGTATIDGVAHYMWQRYTVDGVAIDETYAGGGVMVAPAFSGGGELVAAVRAGGAIYALATNDVADPTPSVALVKIVE